ncbi:hypothetical protein BDV30DRAFT_244273 [Aspergillus minisclerotigenes]|uniref:Uncharacterized protein n=1 Tax=Aspergillus minisclerotigenes TaxID=656917 RepID=A0A5N6IL63_9EURO|nr:hypothetical protein BDV30DRAFT_244273 [Aspergillus minisclerotigenes]
MNNTNFFQNYLPVAYTQDGTLHTSPWGWFASQGFRNIRATNGCFGVAVSSQYGTRTTTPVTAKGQVQSKYFLKNAEDRRTSDARPIPVHVSQHFQNDLTIRHDTHFDLDFYAYDARHTGDWNAVGQYASRSTFELVHKFFHAQLVVPIDRRNAKYPASGDLTRLYTYLVEMATPNWQASATLPSSYCANETSRPVL